MSFPDIKLRRATAQNADEIATIARQSRKHFLPYLPDLHSLDGDQKFYRNRVFPDCQVWAAGDDETLVGFCAWKADWLEHLYLLPTHVGQGLGSALLARAMDAEPILKLWVFQRNQRAIRFYEHHGFRLIRETDGSGNEEKTPDALYEWRRDK